jgi:hypothetical protein
MIAGETPALRKACVLRWVNGLNFTDEDRREK